jgi:hypothetical protein
LWSGVIAERLNLTLLPAGYFAEIQAHVGSRIEIDFATFDSDPQARQVEPIGEADSGGSVATLTAPPKVWTLPAADFSFPAIFPDVFEVLAFREGAGPTLVAAIELVSPGNKDRPEARRAFAAKCASYLQAGVGLMVVDVVTDRQANLHNALADLLDLDESGRLAGGSFLYATAYRPMRQDGSDRVEVWAASLAVGGALPTLPLALKLGPCLPLDLESTYAEVCRRARLDANPPDLAQRGGNPS